MRNFRNCSKGTLGLIVLAFGAGILLTFFLPSRILVIIEACVIIAAGFLYLSQS